VCQLPCWYIFGDHGRDRVYHVHELRGGCIRYNHRRKPFRGVRELRRGFLPRCYGHNKLRGLCGGLGPGCHGCAAIGKLRRLCRRHLCQCYTFCGVHWVRRGQILGRYGCDGVKCVHELRSGFLRHSHGQHRMRTMRCGVLPIRHG
jgi:hypothetical protein